MRYLRSIFHIDTCLPCYLQDHHNRDGELLLGVAVDGGSTVADVYDALLDEWQSDGTEMSEGAANEITAEIERLADEARANIPVAFDASLDPASEEDIEADDYVMAWFLIKWSDYADDEDQAD